MRFDVISVLPDMFTALTQNGVIGRAVESDLIQLNTWNPRRHTSDKHQTVDDRPYGGGPGMVMKPEPLVATVEEIKADIKIDTPQAVPKVIYLSPQGEVFEQKHAQYMADLSEPIIFLAGRYEGIDERVIDLVVDHEFSVGDYVLSGGELGAMVMIDAIARLIPGVLGHTESAQQDSFSDGLLDCPHYTRPEVFAGKAVPSVLLGGNHASIANWRREQSVLRTQARRPDLIEKLADKGKLSDQDHLLLKQEIGQKADIDKVKK